MNPILQGTSCHHGNDERVLVSEKKDHRRLIRSGKICTFRPS